MKIGRIEIKILPKKISKKKTDILLEAVDELTKNVEVFQIRIEENRTHCVEQQKKINGLEQVISQMTIILNELTK